MVTLSINREKISGIELFAFDKDGTLIDLYTYWSTMIRLRAERICDNYGIPRDEHRDDFMSVMGIDLENERLKPEGPVGILPRKIVQKAAEEYLADIGFKDVSGTCFNIFKEVDEISVSFLDELVKPLEGAINLLEDIKESGGKIAIATTDKTERANLALKHLNIEHLVDIVVGDDKVDSPKPDPEMLYIIGKEMNISPENSVMVGDTRTDVQMGVNAGCRASIGVCSGLTERSVLAELTPYVVDDVSCISIER